MNSQLDGRDTRWAEHRLQRRKALVESTLRAIRLRGANVSLDDIAAEAGTSKPVFYRHFGDRPGLYLAVVEKVSQFILDDLRSLPGWQHDDPCVLVRGLAHGYLRLVQRDPEIYRFVMSRPLVEGPAEDPVAGLTMRIGEHVAEILKANGYESTRADTWGHGMVGCVRAATDQWMRAGMSQPVHDVVNDLAALLGPALTRDLISTTSKEYR